MTLAMAVSFRGGALLAAGVDQPSTGAGSSAAAVLALPGERVVQPLRRVAKAPWGIVAGTAPADVVDAVRGLLRRGAAPSPDDLLPFSRESGEGMGDRDRGDGAPCDWAGGQWLFTYESPEAGDLGAWTGAPVWDAIPGGRESAVSVYRSSVYGPVRLSWGAVLLPEAFETDVGREGTLRLHAAVTEDDGQDARFAAVMEAFAWFAEQVPGCPSEVDVGFHEEGHTYSVDRFRVG